MLEIKKIVIAEAIINPVSNRSPISLVQFGHFPFGRQSGAPLTIRFDELDSAPDVTELMIDALIAKITPNSRRIDLVCGIYPGGIRFAAEIASDLGVPYVVYEPLSYRLNTGISEIKPGNGIIVDEQLIFGRGTIRAAWRLKEEHIKVGQVLTIVSYDLPAVRFSLSNLGIEAVSLVTMADIVHHPSFRDRFSPQQIAQATRWISNLR